MRSTVSVAILLGTAAVALDTTSAAAQARRYGEPGYVVAESQWGNGTVSAPVRRRPGGWQVRLPRGTWINCVRSCSETLRQQTVDFWQSNGPQAKGGSGPDYFRWEFRY